MRFLLPVFLVSVLTAACANDDDSGRLPPGFGSPQPFGEEEAGEATFYNATGDGNCSFGPSPNDLMVAAMNNPQWDNSAVCGSCADIVGPNGSVRIRIVDRCPECPSGNLDLSREAFREIAEEAQGRVPITWTRVRCDSQGPVRIKIKEGSSRWWLALQVRNHALPVEQVELLVGADWVPMERQSYNFFIYDAEALPAQGPYRIRVTGIEGSAIEESFPDIVAGHEYQGTHQF